MIVYDKIFLKSIGKKMQNIKKIEFKKQGQKRYHHSEDKVIFLLLFASLILRVIYIWKTDITQRQHDVYSFEEMMGHAGYIGYIFDNLKLPNFDPREIFQFYHPPLHHILAALWMKVNLFIGVSFKQAAENIQILTCIYSIIYLIFTDKIFKKLGLSGGGRIIAFTIIAFHPTFLILSGSINNDMLSIMLMQGALYFSLRWFDSIKLSDIAWTGIFLGLGMMTKLSVGIAAVPIGFLFLVKLIRSKNERVKIFKQFIIFGIICFPLALWWSIRNGILFGVPIGYVPSLGDGSHQFIGNYSIFERLLDFSVYQFKSVYVAWGEPYFEHNIFIGLLKTSVFGEQTLSAREGFIYLAAKILLLSNILLTLVTISSQSVILLRHKVQFKKEHLAFLSVLFIAVLFSYIQFSFSFPHTCTQNIRYATPLIFIGAVSIGKIFSVIKKREFKFGPLKILLVSFVTFFALSSYVFFMVLLVK